MTSAQHVVAAQQMEDSVCSSRGPNNAHFRDSPSPVSHTSFLNVTPLTPISWTSHISFFRPLLSPQKSSLSSCLRLRAYSHSPFFIRYYCLSFLTWEINQSIKRSNSFRSMGRSKIIMHERVNECLATFSASLKFLDFQQILEMDWI